MSQFLMRKSSQKGEQLMTSTVLAGQARLLGSFLTTSEVLYIP